MSRKIKLDKSSKSYIWHCRLEYINETRITKLQRYFDSYNYELYKTCESCLL